MIDIKQSTSSHSVTLEQQRWTWPKLDPNILNKVLRQTIEDEATPATAGKKRRADNTDSVQSKRQKFTDVADRTRTQEEEGEEGVINVPVFKHTYDLTFTLLPPETNNGRTNPSEAYREELEVLKKTLHLCSQSSIISDRGDILLPATVTSYPQDEQLRCRLNVCPLDSKDSFLGFYVDHSSGHQGSGDLHSLSPIGSAHVLGSHYGVELTFSVRLRPTLDPERSSEDALSLKISIDMEGSLLFPKITHAPKAGMRRHHSDAWRALITYLYPPPPVELPNYRGETDIAFLYSILQPAPSLPSPISPADVQPKTLLPSLLPFQRRSVLWMLQREGKTLDEEGNVIPFVPDYLPLFWENVELGGRTMYLNRLKETLSLEPPPPDVERPGGSLNETPGLGKTVECLALILLNPDIQRNPSVKRWDVDMKVYIREVHVSGAQSSV